MTRTPTTEHYDVDIQIEGGQDKISTFANAFVKFTYHIDPQSQRLKPGNAIALQNDLKDESLRPRLPPHSDYWPWKTYTDVAVVGAAHAPEGSEVQTLPVTVGVGKRERKLQMFGQRFVEFERGKPVIGAAEPFTRQDLGIEHAYGGADFRVPFDQQDSRAMAVTLEADHPGLYPRNPWGTGYLAMQDPIEGMRLPTQEDPSDLLTATRLISEPQAWHLQPMPAHVGWVPVNCFPRNIFMAIECDPWFTPPQDKQLREVKLGHLASGYRDLLGDQQFGTPPHWRFHQESTPELMFNKDVHGAPVVLHGLHPAYPNMHFTLPASAPQLKMKFDGTVESLEPFLCSVEIHPDKELLTMTYTASMNAERTFIPGIHKNIPVALSVNGEKAIHYQTPPTVKSLLAKAQAETAKGEHK